MANVLEQTQTSLQDLLAGAQRAYSDRLELQQIEVIVSVLEKDVQM